MIRSLLIFVLILVLYHAVKTVVRSALGAFYGRDDAPSRLPGREMVRDPQCDTYVVKERAVIRRIEGRTEYFCSASCADAYEQRHRS